MLLWHYPAFRKCQMFKGTHTVSLYTFLYSVQLIPTPKGHNSIHGFFCLAENWQIQQSDPQVWVNVRLQEMNFSCNSLCTVSVKSWARFHFGSTDKMGDPVGNLNAWREIRWKFIVMGIRFHKCPVFSASLLFVQNLNMQSVIALTPLRLLSP